MKSIDALITELGSLDVRLWVDDGKLRCSAPNDVLTEALQLRLKESKTELLEFLKAASRPTNSGELPLVQASRDGPIPLTPGQKRIWTLAEMQPDSGKYNISIIYKLVGSLDVSILEKSLEELQRRHEILRTSFPSDQSGPRQHISPPTPLVLPVTNIVKELKKLPRKRWEPEILRLLQIEVGRPFDIKHGPLWRPLLLQIGKKGKYILCLSIHHIIFDGGSNSVLLRDLSVFYRAFSASKSPEVDPLPVQYADFAYWQRERLQGEAGERQFTYWKKQLGGAVTELRLPMDRPRSSAASDCGISKHFELPDDLSKTLALLSQREHASLFAILLAAYFALLHRYSGQDNLVVCSPFASRDRTELEDMIGYFNNVVIMRTDLSANPSFRELIARVRRLAVDASDNQSLPLQRLLELPNLVRIPLTRGMFCFQDLSDRILDLPGINASPIDIRKETADFDLAMYMQSKERGRLSGVLEYDAELFNHETICGFIQNFQTTLEILSTDPDLRLSQLPQFGPKLVDLESSLSQNPQIDQAVIVDLPDRSGSVAYLVLNEFDTPSLSDVRLLARNTMPEYLVPLEFIPLDQIPLNTDGSVDYSALPLPSIVRGRSEVEYIAPHTDLEKKLAEIWRKVLWLEKDVGIHDSFIDLGGHSLLSVQLVIELEKALKRTMPLSVLSRLNTIEDMARILEQGDGDQATESQTEAGSMPREISRETYHALLTYTASWKGERVTPESLVVGFNTAGSKEPLFWCLQRYGELTQLAKYMGTDQPVYGMRSGNRVMVRTQVNIDALAAHYVGEILATKPGGPYFIGGNCQAAQIAFQIAKGLRKQGHEVRLLIILEKFIPQHYTGRIAMLFGAQSTRNPYLYYREPEIGWKKFYTGDHTIDQISGKHGRFFREPNIQMLADTISRRIEEAQKAPVGVEPSSAKVDFQRLPENAYRVKLTTWKSWTAEPGEIIIIPVTITNASPVSWQAGERSGIMLANRWLNTMGKVVTSLDGRTLLLNDLAPNSTTEIELTVTAPEMPGRWFLELDLVDEGVTWFSDQGSTSTRLKVKVTGKISFRAYLSRIWETINSIKGGHS